MAETIAQVTKTVHVCQNCAEVFTEAELQPIRDYHQRVDWGEPCPSGECPKCGALCQAEDTL